MSNSSAKSVTPLVLEPGASRSVRMISLAGLLLALFAIAVLPLAWPLLVLCELLLVACFLYGWQTHHALSGHTVSVRLDSDGNWYWQQAGDSEPVDLQGDSYHLPYLALLHFRTREKRGAHRLLLLSADNIAPETFRQLRVHLNWQEEHR